MPNYNKSHTVCLLPLLFFQMKERVQGHTTDNLHTQARKPKRASQFCQPDTNKSMEEGTLIEKGPLSQIGLWANLWCIFLINN